MDNTSSQLALQRLSLSDRQCGCRRDGTKTGSSGSMVCPPEIVGLAVGGGTHFVFIAFMGLSIPM
jgi:hypothetical protein